VSKRAEVFLVLTLVVAALAGMELLGPPRQGATQAPPSLQYKAFMPAVTRDQPYPVKVTDLLGRSVEIKSKPQNVVGLSPTAVELVYAAGATVVGRASWVDFPEAVKSANDVGTAYQPNFEQILALKPDLIVADSIIQSQPQLRKPIQDLGIPVVFAGAHGYEEVLHGLALMGEVFDARESTSALAATIAKQRDDAKSALAGLSAVILIADRDQTLYAAKPDSYAGDIMAQLGLTNPAASQPDSGPFPGYTTLPPEKLVEYNPDILLTITPAPAPAPRLSTLIPQIPTFKSLNAVVGNRVAEADVQLFLAAPGPRIVDAFQAVVAVAARR
jgi:iron complex transport system substrate-binding protein